MNENTNTNAVDIDVIVADAFTQTTYTPYAMCKIVNELLRAFEIDKQLPPQMFYTYAKKQYIVNDNKIIKAEHAIAFTVKYITKNI